MVHFYVNNALNSRKRAQYNIDAYNWNHFVFTYFRPEGFGIWTYYLTSRNVQYYDYGDYSSITIRYNYWTAPAGVKLSKIFFCTFDERADYLPENIKQNVKLQNGLMGFIGNYKYLI